MRFFPSITLVLASLAVATGENRHPTGLRLDSRDEECENNFSLCSPTGASSVNTPAVGTELSSLYLDLVDSIQGVRKNRRAVDLDHQIVDHKLQPRGSKIGLCCRVASTYHTYFNTDLLVQYTWIVLTQPSWSGAIGTNCLLLKDLNLPFCYVRCALISPPQQKSSSSSKDVWKLGLLINPHFADHQTTNTNRTNSRPTSSSQAAPPVPLSQATTPRPTATL